MDALSFHRILQPGLWVVLGVALVVGTVVASCGSDSNDTGSVGTQSTATSEASVETPPNATPTVIPATIPPTREPLATQQSTVTATASPDPTESSTATATQTSASPTALESVVEVIIDEFRFTPAILEIDAGTSVIFINEESYVHTATSREYPYAFDTGTLDNSESATVVFDTPGTFDYICLIHPTMAGTIVVK